MEPIHLLRHHEGRFHWICTNGDITSLQTATDDKYQTELGEETFIEEIETDLQFQTNQLICISDSPGMGKSLLLASIGRQLQQLCPQRYVAFVVISEFVIRISELLPQLGNMEKYVLEALLQMLCENNAARERLVQKITKHTENPSTQIELMFDGFDEVSTENIDLAHECLELLRANFNMTTRLWVTTRPQHLQELEKRFSVLGFNIQAFQEKNQIEFLTSYWNSDGMNLDGVKLQFFSNNCLGTLKKKLNKKDEDIAGIPLQCMMIAEVYMQDAVLFCDSKNKRLGNFPEAVTSIDVKSIADLYEKMIAYKIEKFIGTYPLQPEEIGNIWPLHMYRALQLIFPLHVQEFKDALKIESGLKEDYLVNIGILECSGSTTKDPPRFIHRTFAEYLAARFFVLYFILDRTANLQNVGQWRSDFLFEHVLECSVYKVLSGVLLSTFYKCSFNHSVLCHFLDALLGAQTNISTESSITKNSTNYVKNVIYACIHSDFGNIIKFLCTINYPDSFCINDLYLDSEILLDGTRMASLDLLKLLMHNFNSISLTAIEVDSPQCSHTALHAAVRRGSYTIFEYILKEHDFENLVKKDKKFLDLVYWAVQDTAHIDIDGIQDRAEIVTALCDLNMEMVNHCNNFKRTPLLADSVHILLLKRLIECGVNLIDFDDNNNTILHQSTKYLSSTDYYDLLQFIPNSTLITLLKIPNAYTESSLHLIVKSGIATQNILKLIVSNEFDINTKSIRGFTCLFYAVQMENEDMTTPTVKLLLENGADYKILCENADSIVHYSAERGRIECLRFFLDEKKMSVNQTNDFGHSPIFNALHNPISAIETVQFLLERGADHKILNSNRENLLHYSASCRQLKCLELFLSLGGLDVNELDDDGFTPLLYAFEEDDESTVKMIQLLLGHGADHKILNKDGNFLHRLAEIGNTELFIHFVGLPLFDVNVTNGDNDTPLHLVVKNIKNYYDIHDDFNSFLYNIENLVSLGADVNARNDNGETPLKIYRRAMLAWQGEIELMKKYLTICRILDGERRDNGES